MKTKVLISFDENVNYYRSIAEKRGISLSKLVNFALKSYCLDENNFARILKEDINNSGEISKLLSDFINNNHNISKLNYQKIKESSKDENKSLGYSEAKAQLWSHKYATDNNKNRNKYLYAQNEIRFYEEYCNKFPDLVDNERWEELKRIQEDGSILEKGNKKESYTKEEKDFLNNLEEEKENILANIKEEPEDIDYVAYIRKEKEEREIKGLIANRVFKTDHNEGNDKYKSAQEEIKYYNSIKKSNPEFVDSSRILMLQRIKQDGSLKPL
jgi:hypothetical protein